MLCITYSATVSFGAGLKKKANVLFGTSIKVKYEIRLLGHTFFFVIFRRLTPVTIPLKNKANT